MSELRPLAQPASRAFNSAPEYMVPREAGPAHPHSNVMNISERLRSRRVDGRTVEEQRNT
jgi:hypothetical protein